MRNTIVFLVAVMCTAWSWGIPSATYQITNVSGGSISVVVSGSQYTLTATPATGYVFYQWEDGSTNPERQMSDVTTSQTLSATFAPIWKVTFQDGVGDDEIEQVFQNTECSIDKPTRSQRADGKILYGWASAPDALRPDVNFPLKYDPSYGNRDTTFYAVWGETTIHIDTDSSMYNLIQELGGYADQLDIVIENGGKLSWKGSAVMSTWTFKSLTIKPGGIYVKSGSEQTKSNTWGQVIMEAGEADESGNYSFLYPCMHHEKTSYYDKSDVDTLFYDYLLSKRQQYPLCLPRDVRIADIRYTDGTPAVYGTDFKVAYYDGAKRATGASGWAYLSDTTTFLKRGIGYTVYAKPLPGQSYSRLRFPMRLYNTNNGKTDNFLRNQACTINATSCPADKPNDAGWHLVGNPMFSYMNQINSASYLASDSPIGLLEQQDDGTYRWVGSQRYVVVPNYNGTSYSSELVSDMKIAPFNIFFIQVDEGEKIYIAPTYTAENAPARMLAAEEDANETMVGVILSQNNNTQNADKMGVLIGENFTEAYEINADLQKFGHNAGVNVYAWANQSELAFIALNETLAQNIPVGFIAPQAGQYIFSYNSAFDKTGVQSVYLYDSETQTTTDLLIEDYSFNVPSAQTNNSRFILSVGLRKTATDHKEISLPMEDGTPRKFFRNGQLYIVRDDMMYNAQGHKLTH